MTLRRIVSAIAIVTPLLFAGCSDSAEQPQATTPPQPDIALLPDTVEKPDAASQLPVAEQQVSSLPEAPAADIATAPALNATLDAHASGPSPQPIASVTSSVHDRNVGEPHHARHAGQASVDVLCEQIGNKLGSVSVEDCARQNFVFGGGFSVKQRPLVIKDYRPADADGFRVLIMGGIHGDEYSSISILFKWLAGFSPDDVEGAFHWRFAPLVNPDGLLDGGRAQRQNANGVDLNRNFPSRDWNDSAVQHWQESTGRNPRRFPGEHAASEPEVQWVVEQIEEFQPDVIVSVHAPYHLLDFDGPAEAPAKIGELKLHQLGVYPGSLGNFAGLNRAIPVVTLELPSAGIMPPADQIDLMWNDLVAWLDREGRRNLGQL
ncbi:MAG: M14 family zinc carboxypeptidase [Gammaproteobacteria bacterium]